MTLLMGDVRATGRGDELQRVSILLSRVLAHRYGGQPGNAVMIRGASIDAEDLRVCWGPFRDDADGWLRARMEIEGGVSRWS
jgi:hypothetical protein